MKFLACDAEAMVYQTEAIRKAAVKAFLTANRDIHRAQQLFTATHPRHRIVRLDTFIKQWARVWDQQHNVRSAPKVRAHPQNASQSSIGMLSCFQSRQDDRRSATPFQQPQASHQALPSHSESFGSIQHLRALPAEAHAQPGQRSGQENRVRQASSQHQTHAGASPDVRLAQEAANHLLPAHTLDRLQADVCTPA